MPEKLANFIYKIVDVVLKATQVRVPGPRPSKHFSRSPAQGWMRAARICVVFLACLAQSWLPAQRLHAMGFAAHSVVHETAASDSGAKPASFGAGQAGVPCALHGTHASPDSGGPAPCHNNECPFCPCPCCCAQVHAAIGILPQVAAPVAYAPLLSTSVAPPALLGSLARFAIFAGQPRAPPILI
jgi:hypothetical protein